MRDLAKEVWKDFNELKDDSKLQGAIVDTMPVLYFGDYNAYKESKIKIVTVSLNPSDVEFLIAKTDSQYDYFRFPEAKKLHGKRVLEELDIDTYLGSLNAYFQTVPYKKWFDDNRRELFDVLNASYYYGIKDTNQNCNVPIHIDIATSVATHPTWAFLSDDEKQIFMKKEKETWKKLIKLLSPDIMLMSLDSKYINEVDNELYKGLQENEVKYKENGNKRSNRYLTYDYPCENGKIIKVMDIVTANKAFQFAQNGVGYAEFAKILKKWKGEILCQK